MVSEELFEINKRLEQKLQLYKKATKRGRNINKLGAIIILLALLYYIIIALSLSGLLLVKSISFYTWIGGSIIGFFIGFLLVTIGTREKSRNAQLAPFAIRELFFLKIFGALNDIETYQKEGYGQSRRDAAKKLSEFQEEIKEPVFVLDSLWESLTEEENENLRLFKRNIKERLNPNITQGNEEEIEKVHSILEKIAKYLINPTITELDNLNKSISELKLYYEKDSLMPKLAQSPKLRHAFFLIVFVIISIFISFVGKKVGVSTDYAYIGGITLFGVQSTLYGMFISRS